jgi:3(or 17)beta-hydroxysteroid dehydrogenase
MNRVSGKIAVVSGAGSGLGEAIARLLAREGASVMVADVNDKAGQRVARQIRSEGGAATFMHLDVAQEDDWSRVMAQVRKRHKGLHVMVNCAGINVGRSFPAETSLEDWNRVMSVNLDGVFLGTKHALALMTETQPVNGSIINISSVMGMLGYAGIGPYCASKGGVRLYSKSVAISCAEKGLKVRVNSVHPGFIDTPLLRQGMKSIPDAAEAERIYNQLQPVGHLGEPDDIAYGVLYLASDESKFVTGTELVIDGGYTAR